MTVRKKDRVLLPDESHAVVIRGVDRDNEEVTLFFERTDGTSGTMDMSNDAFNRLAALRTTGTGDPNVALAALWGYWIKRAIADIRQTTLATTPLQAYAHQDEAVFEVMLPQPTLRFLLADDRHWENDHGGHVYHRDAQARIASTCITSCSRTSSI